MGGNQKEKKSSVRLGHIVTLGIACDVTVIGIQLECNFILLFINKKKKEKEKKKLLHLYLARAPSVLMSSRSPLFPGFTVLR